MKKLTKQLLLLAVILGSTLFSTAQVTGPPYTNIGAGSNLTLTTGNAIVDSGHVSIGLNGRRYQMADATGQHRSVLRYGVIGSSPIPANSNNIIFGNNKGGGDIYMVTSGASSGVGNEINRLTIKAGGNIGLSTNAPTSVLDINGDLRIRVVPIDTTLDTVLVIDAMGNVRKKYMKCCCDTTTSPRYASSFEDLKSKYDAQALMIADLQNQINELKNSNNNSSSNDIGFGLNEASVKLYQNNPNPFTEQTSISYDIPLNTSSARVIIFDMQGTQLKSFEISDFGKGAITVNGGELKAGMYMYSLIINGKEADTKRMILTR